MKLAAIVFRLRVVVSAMHATFTTELQNYIGDSLTSALRSSQAGFIRASPALRERLLLPVSRSGGGCGGGHPSAGTSQGTAVLAAAFPAATRRVAGRPRAGAPFRSAEPAQCSWCPSRARSGALGDAPRRCALGSVRGRARESAAALCRYDRERAGVRARSPRRSAALVRAADSPPLSRRLNHRACQHGPAPENEPRSATSPAPMLPTIALCQYNAC